MTNKNEILKSLKSENKYIPYLKSNKYLLQDKDIFIAAFKMDFSIFEFIPEELFNNNFLKDLFWINNDILKKLDINKYYDVFNVCLNINPTIFVSLDIKTKIALINHDAFVLSVKYISEEEKKNLLSYQEVIDVILKKDLKNYFYSQELKEIIQNYEREKKLSSMISNNNHIRIGIKI